MHVPCTHAAGEKHVVGVPVVPQGAPSAAKASHVPVFAPVGPSHDEARHLVNPLGRSPQGWPTRASSTVSQTRVCMLQYAPWALSQSVGAEQACPRPTRAAHVPVLHVSVPLHG